MQTRAATAQPTDEISAQEGRSRGLGDTKHTKGDDPISLSQMISLIQNLIQDARRDDIATIGRTMAVHDSRIGAVEHKMVLVDKKVDDVRDELEKIRASIAAGGGQRDSGASTRTGRSSTASTSAPREAHEWQPRLVDVKGWAPNGSPVAAKLNKIAAQSLQEELCQATAAPHAPDDAGSEDDNQ